MTTSTMRTTHHAPAARRRRYGGRLARALAGRWPALAGAALVTALVPLGVALASDFGPSVFTATGSGPALRALGATGSAIDAAGGSIGIQANGSTFGVDATGGNGGTGAAVRASAISATGLDASSDTGTAVKATSNKGTAIDASAFGNAVALRAHVTGSAGSSIAVDAGFGADTGVKAQGAVAGVNATGGQFAVKATSTDGLGVQASSTNGTAVEAYGKLAGVKAISSDGTGLQASGAVRGVSAYADKAGSQGLYAFGGQTGVYAEGGKVGGEFSGIQAPIRLQPATTPGKPQAVSGVVHQVGELYVDANGDLYLCKAAGTPGTWVKIG